MFLVAFVLVVFAVLMLMGKIDFLLANYRLAFIDRKLKFVKCLLSVKYIHIII